MVGCSRQLPPSASGGERVVVVFCEHVMRAAMRAVDGGHLVAHSRCQRGQRSNQKCVHRNGAYEMNVDGQTHKEPAELGLILGSKHRSVFR